MADVQKVLQVVIQARDDASKTLDNFSAKLKDVSYNAMAVGTGLIALGANPTAALLGAAKAAIDFESSFAGIRKTVDASEVEFQQLEENIRQLALTTPTTTEEMNKIGELAGQLGVRGVKDLTAFIETIAMVGVTTNITTESAATSFARIANIMQLPIDQVENMASTVVDLGNNFATTESEIVGFAERIAGAGTIAGFTTNDILGIAAAMSSVGVEAEAGGTAVQKMMINMNTAVVQGNADLQIFAETAGMTSAEFVRAYEDEANGAFTEFVVGLGRSGDDAITILDDLGLADQRLVRAFLSLANAGDLVTRSAKMSGEAWTENTALVKEAEKRYETTASQLKILKNNIDDVALTLGEVLLPKINEILEAIKPYIQKLGDLIEAHPQLTAVVLLLGAALGGLGVIVVGLGVILGALAVVLSPLGLAFLAVAASVAVLTAAGVLLYRNWDEIKAKAEEIWGSIRDTIQGIIDAIVAEFDQFMESVMFNVNKMRDWVQGILDLSAGDWAEYFGVLIGTLIRRGAELYDEWRRQFDLLWQSLKDVDDNMKISWEQFLVDVKTVYEIRSEDFKQFWIDSWEVIKLTAKNIWDGIKQFWADLLAGIGEVLSQDFPSISDLWSEFWDEIVATVTGAVGGIIGWVDDAISAIDKLLDRFEKGVDFGVEFPSFQHGGFVDAPYGQAVPAILHGGERVLPRNAVDTGGGGGVNLTLNFTGPVSMDSDFRVKELANKIMELMGRQSELASKGVAI